MHLRLKIFYAFAFSLLPLLTFSQSFNLTWENIIDGYKVNSEMTIADLESDINGDFIIAGYKDTAVNRTMFLKKLHPDGSEDFNITDSTIFPISITTDIQGNIYVGGRKEDISQYQFVINKYDSAGNFQWMMLHPTYSSFFNEVLLSSDSSGNVYFGINYGPGSGILLGKVDSSGNLIHSITPPSTTSLQFLKVISNQQFLTVYSQMGIVQASLYDSASAIISFHLEQNMDVECNAAMDDNGNLFLVGKNAIFDSASVIKLDASLNVVWRKSNQHGNWSSKPLVNYSVNGFYVLFFENPAILICFNNSGNVSWQNSTNTNALRASLRCDKFGYAYLGMDTIDFNSNTKYVNFQQYDSTGTLRLNKMLNRYFGSFSDVNSFGKYVIAFESQEPNMYGYRLFGCDSSVTDTFSVVYENYQSKDDRGQFIRRDYNGDIISVCQVTDTAEFPSITYVNCIEIFKHDINGNLIWRTRVRPTLNAFVEDVHIDYLNNIYLCGTADSITFNITYAIYALKISSSGQKMWTDFLYDQVNNGTSFGNSITTDTALNVYYSGTYDTTHSNQDGIVCKLDSSGNRQWIKYFASPTNGGDGVYSLIHRNNHIYALANMYTSINEFYIYDLDTASNTIRQLSYNYGQNATVNQLLIDSNNNFYCFGYSSFPVISLYVTKFDSAGVVTCEFRDTVLGNFDLIPIDASISGNGDMYITGVRFHNGQSTYFTLQLDQNCNLSWIDSVQNNRGSNIDYNNGIIYATSLGTQNDSGFVVAYDTSGTILFKSNLPNNQGNYFNFDVLADTNAFYLLGTIKSFNTADDILLRKYNESVLGVNENILSSNENIFPNPSVNLFNISFPKVCDNLVIYDSMGRVIESIGINDNEHSIQINLEWKTKGVYPYVLLFEGEKIYCGKLVKM